MAHERRLQDIANANRGTRYVGTPGYAASVDYVANQLRAAGYNVTVQSFQVQHPLGATRPTSNVNNLQNPSPPGSGQIEKVFTDYYAAVGLPTKPHLKTSSDLAPSWRRESPRDGSSPAPTS